MKRTREWTINADGSGWGEGGPLPAGVDAQGYPLALNAGQYVDALMCTHELTCPAGVYNVYFEGTGSGATFPLSITGDVQDVVEASGHVQFTKGVGGFILRIEHTNPSDHIRDIRTPLPGYEDSYQTDPWYPPFMALWQRAALLRLMGQQNTNGHPGTCSLNRQRTCLLDVGNARATRQ